MEVEPGLFAKYSVTDQTAEYHRAQIRQARGFRPASEYDEPQFSTIAQESETSSMSQQFGATSTAEAPKQDATANATRRAAVIALIATIAAALIGAAATIAVALLQSKPSEPTPPTDHSSEPASPDRVVLALSAPISVGLSPDGRRGYIVDHDDNSITVVDTATHRSVAQIPIGQHPTQIAVTPDNRYAYVTNYGTSDAPGHTVSVIDTVALTVVATIQVGTDPYGIVIAPNGRAFVANYGTSKNPGNTISVIDTPPVPSPRR